MELRGGIIASYAAGAVTGTTVGGLVGRNDGPSVFERSYATGRVSGNLDVGGLVGTNASGITASYSTGPASATSSTDSSVGGLVGANESGFHRIRASYWDSTTSGIAGGQSTAALQGPTGDTGIYGAWNGPWHFGTSSQYPALSVDFDGNGDETWQEFGHQLRAGPELTATGGEGQVVLNWLPVDAGHWTPAPGITYTLYRDATVVAENLSTLSYQDSGLTAGDYTYQLAAVVNGGEATRSALVTGTVSEVRPNDQPQFPSSETGARSVDENTAAGRNIGTAIAAEDADNDTLTYSIAGADAAFFDVVTTSGQLQTRTALDRESRATYSFTMSVHDGKDIERQRGHGRRRHDHRDRHRSRRGRGAHHQGGTGDRSSTTRRTAAMRLPATQPMIQRTRTSTGDWRGPTAISSRLAPAVCLRSSCRPTTRCRRISAGTTSTTSPWRLTTADGNKGSRDVTVTT